MKLPTRILDKIKEKEDFIRREMGNSYYEWISNSETELLKPDDYKKIVEILSKASD